MMKKTILCLLLWAIVSGSFAQLVRKKDYDAAFALQLGGETGLLTTFHQPEIALRPVGGLKMTFPFNRKWFLGSEIAYSELKYKFSVPAGEKTESLPPDFEQGAEFHLRQLRVPLYIKYMLNCNKASVLFGFYGAWVFDPESAVFFKQQGEKMQADIPVLTEDWHAGITVGYEHRIVKHLDIMCQLNLGLKEVVKTTDVFKDKLFPLQASVTLSYDVFRIGDCGCD